MQVFLMMNLLFTAYLFAYRLSASESEVVMDRFTNGFIHIYMLYLLLFTDFVTDKEV